MRDLIALTLLRQFQSGHVGRIAVTCQEPLDEDTDKRLRRKGFIISGDRAKADLVVIYGPIVMYIGESNSALACISFGTLNIQPMSLSQVYLFNIISELKDQAPVSIPAELVALQRMLTEEDDTRNDHGSHYVAIDLVLPEGKTIHSRMCIHCANEFVSGRTDGAEFMTPEWTKTLVAYLLVNGVSSQAGEIRVEDKAESPGSETHH